MSSGTVLLIEADDADASLMESVFTTAGYQVMRASEGRAGIELARAVDPALIMLAVELPGLSGYKACRDIKQDPELAAIPLVITSSTATEDTFAQHRTFKTRADEYLHKPLDPEGLRSAIGRFISLDATAAMTPALASAAPQPEDDDDDDLFLAADPDDELDASLLVTGEHTAVLDDEALGEESLAAGDADLLDAGGDELLSIDADLGSAFGDEGLDLEGVLEDLEVGSDVLEVAEDDELLGFDDESLVAMEELVEDEPEAATEPPVVAAAPAAAPPVHAAQTRLVMPAYSAPTPASEPPAAASSDGHDDLRATLASLEAQLAAARESEAASKQALDALTGENETLRATVERLRADNALLAERLAGTGEALLAEFEAMKAKLEHARAEIHQARGGFYHFVSTLQSVLGEKADELRAFGPFPELGEQ